MKISIIHPSRSRPEIAYETACKWLARSDGKVEYILSLDHDDPLLEHYSDVFTSTLGVYRLYHNNKSAIDAINAGAKFSEGDLLIVVSDDFDCPEHWDTLLLTALADKWDFCVKTDDGIQPTLMTLPIVDRIYYNRFGYIYHPDYLHMESDVEMTAVAHMLGRNIYVPLLFQHNHYSRGLSVKDAISVKNDSTYGQGKEVLNRRLQNNFGIENPVCSFKSIKWH